MAATLERKCKERKYSNGAKLLSVIDRLSYRNENKSLQIRQEEKIGSVVTRVENRSNEESLAKYAEKNEENRLKNFDVKHSEEVSESRLLDGQQYLENLLLVENVQLTLKPGIPNGAKPSLCFCKSSIQKKSKVAPISQQETAVSKQVSPPTLVQPAEVECDLVKQVLADEIVDNEVQFNEPPTQVKNKSSICGVCLLEFFSALSFQKHQKEEGHYLCSECGEILENDISYKEHLNKKLCKKVTCTLCGQRFITRDEVEKHKAEMHYKCLKCNKLYRTPEKLSLHNERLHRAPYICLQCGEEFPTHSLCKRHTKSRHTKKYFCPECGKGFARMTILNRHVMCTHTDERKYKCEVCSKAFKRKDALKTHRVIHSNDKPFQCKKCGKQFNQKISLIKHSRCEKQKTQPKSEATMARIDSRVNGKTNCDYSITESCETSTSNAHRTAVGEPYVGCSCPPTCPCKEFSIGLQVNSEERRGPLASQEEIASLSCCCDFELVEVN